MLYTLIIADDEQMMRNGLTNAIKWEELGFSLEGVFSDGSEVLEYLKQNVVDVLLIDIKMTKVSGIEVAKFIFENKLSIKVIFLSGYKDFEFAQQAVEYNVEHYMLKPFSILKLKEVFISVREKLDEQNELEKEINNRVKRYNKIVDFEKEQFIIDLFMGAFTSDEDLYRRLTIIDENKEWLLHRTLIFSISLHQSASLKNFIDEYGSQELNDQLAHILRSFSKRLEFFPLEIYNNRLQGIYVEKPETNSLATYWDTELGQAKFEDHIKALIKMMLDIEVSVEVMNFLPELKSLTHYHQKSLQALNTKSIQKAPSLLHDLWKQKKLIISYAIQGNMERALPLFESFINQVGGANVDFVRNQVNHLLLTLVDKCSDGNPIISEELMELTSITDLYSLMTDTSIIRWGKDKLRKIVDYLNEKELLSDGNDSIHAIKKYISENYDKDITLNDIGELVCMHPTYVSRLFKERTGNTVTEYITRERMRIATEYLDNTTDYVYEISEKVGYRDVKHFYKIFKKLMGCSPKDYRERDSKEPI